MAASIGAKVGLGLGCGCLLVALFAFYTCGYIMKDVASRAHEYKDTDPIGFTARTEAWELCKKDILGRLKAPAQIIIILRIQNRMRRPKHARWARAPTDERIEEG